MALDFCESHESLKNQNMPRSTSKKSGTPQSGLEEFFLQELKDIYGAEKQLTKAIPKMQKAATTQELKEALEEHLEITKEQIARLEEVFELMDVKPQSKKCEAMEGITKEGESVIEETETGSMTRDAAIIMAAQKVEHYEIATYGGLVQLAKTIGRDEVAEILAQTLEEEKEADQLLSEIAEASINEEAEQEDAD
jgi:ferritin-like metal-binding protein YciE